MRGAVKIGECRGLRKSREFMRGAVKIGECRG